MKRNMKRSPLDGWCRIALEVSLLAVFGAVSAVNAGERDDERDRPVPLTVPKAVCGANDHPETALQGQVPAAMRAAHHGRTELRAHRLRQQRKAVAELNRSKLD